MQLGLPNLITQWAPRRRRLLKVLGLQWVLDNFLFEKQKPLEHRSVG